MLSASREDILQDNGWNKTVMVATLDLFVSSIDTFNKKHLVQYTWPRYLKTQGNAHGTVFQMFFSTLVDTKSLPVLGSMTFANAALTSSAVMLMYFSNVMSAV